MGAEFKPMLAVKAELDKVVYPVLASPKLDGCRCVTLRDGGPLMRSLLSVPNDYVRTALERWVDLDGELVVGNPTAKNVFNVTQSAIMSQDGIPDFRFYVFDHLGMEDKPFWERLGSVFMRDLPAFIVPVEHKLMSCVADVEAYAEECLAAGYEGAMLRSLDGPYKHGRSTLKQGWLLKVKNFLDAEAVIVGYEELMHNDNVPTINALGLQERSSHKENLRRGGVLGAVIGEMNWNGARTQFKCGTGFSAAERMYLWSVRDQLPGQMFNFKYQKEGSKDRPRIPVWKGLRDRRDM
jgi:DNA ligase-1